ncbi:hypothetical protein SOVF_116700 [Spinacia oleracea]|nr:hypothetical protein SOVF_116700 [Spinacia oleracea]
MFSIPGQDSPSGAFGNTVTGTVTNAIPGQDSPGFLTGPFGGAAAFGAYGNTVTDTVTNAIPGQDSPLAL